MNDIDPNTEAAVLLFLERLAQVYDRYEIAGAILYGSRARGTHDPDSDADVAVLLRGAPRDGDRTLSETLKMADVAFDVFLELDTPIIISPLPVWLSEWEHPENHTNPALLRNIYREGIRL